MPCASALLYHSGTATLGCPPVDAIFKKTVPATFLGQGAIASYREFPTKTWL
jgi:hypothetical protein